MRAYAFFLEKFHNRYLELLAENGYPDLILYLSGIGSVLILLRKTRTVAKTAGNQEVVRLCHALEIAVVAFLWRGMTGSNQMADILYWYLGMTGGLWYYTKRQGSERMEQART